MDIQWFKDLGSLANTGNFSQAAELNNISQSAFSRRIRALEVWVGASLVDRSKHPVKLTAAGEQMLAVGRQALSRIEAEREHIREALAQPDRYVITFAAQHSIGGRFYLSWLQAFEKSFGPIISRLRADDLPNCIVDLKRGEVDFVISYESETASGVDSAKKFDSLVIGRDRLIPVCKTDTNGEPLFKIDGNSSVAIPYLRFGKSAPIGRHVEPILKKRNLIARLSPVYENSMGGALRVQARDGLGVAWLPQSLVEPDISSGLLTWAGGEEWAIDVDIRLHRLRRNHNMLIRKIWTFLKLREGVPLI
jgi:DNA-binding transcriptional LysR family regulator